MFDDGPHFFGVQNIEVNEVGKTGNRVGGIQLEYREDGVGGMYGKKRNYDQNSVGLKDGEEIESVTVRAQENENERVLHMIEFVTTAGRKIHFGRPEGDFREDNDEYETATFTAPEVGLILGGIHGSFNTKNPMLATIGVYWVKKSPIRRVPGGNILIGPGSLFLDDTTISEKVPQVQSISGALEWIEQDTTSRFGTRNPVILFQISEDTDVGGPCLVVHRERFLQQSWGDYAGSTAAEFADLTTYLVERQNQLNALPGVDVYYIVGVECEGGAAPEGSACTTGEECCSGLCDSGSCVHKAPAGGMCRDNDDCDFIGSWLYCSWPDGVCVEDPVYEVSFPKRAFFFPVLVAFLGFVEHPTQAAPSY
jgi:hypothetical protein